MIFKTLALPAVTAAEQTKSPIPGLVKNSFPIAEMGYLVYLGKYSKVSCGPGRVPSAGLGDSWGLGAWPLVGSSNPGPGITGSPGLDPPAAPGGPGGTGAAAATASALGAPDTTMSIGIAVCILSGVQ